MGLSGHSWKGLRQAPAIISTSEGVWVAQTFTGLERWNSLNHTKTSTFAFYVHEFHQNSLKFCWLGEKHNYFSKSQSFFGAILFFY